MRHVWPDFCLPLPPHSCVHDGVYERQRRGTEYALDSEWERLQQEADLYRLATHVHRGQSARSRKCAYKWGSYFYFSCHFTRSLYNRSLYTSVGSFSGTSSYFSSHYCLPTSFCVEHWNGRSSLSEVSLPTSQVSRPLCIHWGLFCPGFPTVGHTVPWTAPSPLPSFPHDFWPAPILLK